MMAVGWFYWIASIACVGYLVMCLCKGLPVLERLFSGLVAGFGILPFVLFLSDAFFHVNLFAHPLRVLIALLLMGLIVLALQLTRRKKKDTRLPRVHLTPITLVGTLIALATVVIFFIRVTQGLQLPLFGWDEYSYWLYAAKVMTLTHGSSTSMASDAYATYPLGFPYLVAWLYDLTNNISIQHAKWVTPITSLFTVTALCFVLRRIGANWFVALCAASLMVWGSQAYYWFNVVAYGEVSYVNLYTLSVVYGIAWLHTNSMRDLTVFGLFLGLSTFFRVDGSIIAVFTIALLLVCNFRTAITQKMAILVRLLVTVGLPILAWWVFKFVHHIHPGWNSRITMKEIGYRLSQPFFNKMISSFWSTLSNLDLYPISIGIIVILVVLIFVRSRSLVFCLGIVVTQVLYLFAAYLTVFSRLEAESSASVYRYLLRIDPILAVALALAIWVHTQKRRTYISQGI